MRRFTRAVAVMTLAGALGSFIGSTVVAGEGKGARNQRGLKADEHKSGKGFLGSHTQWSADPERGWVRREEQRDSREDKRSSEQGKQKRGKQNNKGKTNKP